MQDDSDNPYSVPRKRAARSLSCARWFGPLRKGYIRKNEAAKKAALLTEPTEREGYRTKESCQQDSRKHERLQRNLILAHVPFST
jgi:hypothetical protein